MIVCVLSLRVNSFGDRLVFYREPFVVYYCISLYLCKNSICGFEYLKSNLIVLCFWCSSLINFSSSSSVPVHIMNRSSMNRKSVIIFSLYIGIYTFWFEAYHKNISVSGNTYSFDLKIMFTVKYEVI